MADGNLFENADPPDSGERFDDLLRHRNLVVERIVSAADSPPQTYRQAQDEWVVLLRGEATIEIDGRSRRLTVGDHVFIAADTPHSVLATSAGALWLAVHLHPGAV